MKTVYTILIFLVSVTLSFSQHKQEIEKEVNEQIWKPFKKSFETRDWKSFNRLHSDEVLRVNKYGIRTGAEYKNSIEVSYQKPTTKKRQIDFCFNQRTYKENTGYEVGYYRVIYTEKDKESRIVYGRFHVVLNKKNGTWLIAQDWDTDTMNGKLITKEDFESGSCLNTK
ncbi:nuclear transport factor 2 family protein [Tenacibaculum sp. FZY0031]|uniref:nuclear transport factor 2 family protein n=1 Tax=unclassified Tenacibaculum TaxID=2635139 RepID=UPI002ECCB908|nr:nuclear transport factor 2 family protein [Tenacibaculum sp. FZY0031]